ncbi:uncharacterized protein LOC6565729 [Drosophila grimshawi]|uniref:GH24733 n=1 Tax=Drosophila grimshawi TaxID=7222 RepID=B4JN19_DROGR|nr:uncharacterized protein LOC6565729 [Drosophila grimshawi]EDV92112.1 GH24733 [Drosophila grimshawi]
MYVQLMIAGCNASDECLHVHKVTHVDLEAISPDKPVSSIATNIKCYTRCLIKDYIGSDNKLDLARLGPNASAYERLVMRHCKQIFDGLNAFSDPCDYGYLVLQCMTINTKPRKLNLLTGIPML